MRGMAILAVLSAGALAAGAALAQPGHRPVRVGLAGADLDACLSLAEVQGLDPNGDNFLTVRAAPVREARSLDRLGPGQQVWVCEEASGWSGIVYATRRNGDCHVGSPVPRPRPYAGPCRQGWVASRYLVTIAG